jgi:hypothetical protein
VTDFNKVRRILIAPLVVLALGSIGQTLFAVPPRLSEDDVLLLLMGSAPPGRKAELIRLHGIESDWRDDFRARLGALCLEENVRAALEQALRETRLDSQPGFRSPQSTGPDSTPTPGQGAASLLPRGPGFDSVGIKIEACGQKRLAAPDERLLSTIVERLTNNDARLEHLLKSYTFHTSILARKMDPSGTVLGSYYGEWDVMFTDRGKRISHQVANSPDTTDGSVHLLRGAKMEPGQALTFLPEDRNDYTFRYVDHVVIDEIGAYQLSVAPKKVEGGKVYFKGMIWVEDRSLQIVKAEGNRVPSFEQGSFGWRFYPRYVTFRSQSDGRFWLPTLTVSEGMANGIRLNSVIKYFAYHRFGSESTLLPIPDDAD